MNTHPKTFNEFAARGRSNEKWAAKLGVPIGGEILDPALGTPQTKISYVYVPKLLSKIHFK